MNHQDHIALLKDGVATEDGIWADFGSGTGAFTLVEYNVDRGNHWYHTHYLSQPGRGYPSAWVLALRNSWPDIPAAS